MHSHLGRRGREGGKKGRRRRRRRSVSAMLYLLKQFTFSALHRVWPDYQPTTIAQCSCCRALQQRRTKILLNCILCIFNGSCSRLSVTPKPKLEPRGLVFFWRRSRWRAAENCPAALTDLWHVPLTAAQPPLTAAQHNANPVILSSGCCEIKTLHSRPLLYHSGAFTPTLQQP